MAYLDLSKMALAYHTEYTISGWKRATNQLENRESIKFKAFYLISILIALKLVSRIFPSQNLVNIQLNCENVVTSYSKYFIRCQFD